MRCAPCRSCRTSARRWSCIWSRSARRWSSGSGRRCRGTDVPVDWHRVARRGAGRAAIILANEFFDALPVHQAVMCVDGWHERVVKIADNGKLAVQPRPRSDPAVRPDAAAAAARRADRRDLRMARRPDRARDRPPRACARTAPRWSSTTATPKAPPATPCRRSAGTPSPIRCSRRASSTSPRMSISRRWRRRRESMGAACTARSTRPTFLRRLGIETRAEALKKGAPLAKTAEIDSALARLTSDGTHRHGQAVQGDGGRRSEARRAAGIRGPASQRRRHPARNAPDDAMLHAASLASLPGIRHAFFTRAGRRVGRHLCKPQRRRRLARCAGACRREPRAAWRARSACAPDNFLTAYQIHSPDVVTVEQPWAPDARPRADAHRDARAGPRGRRLDRRLRAGPVRRRRRARDRRRACRLARRLHRRARGDDRRDGEARRRPRQHRRRARPDDPAAELRSGPGIRRPLQGRRRGQRALLHAGARDGHAMFDLAGYIAARLAARRHRARSRTSAAAPMPTPTRFYSYRRSVHRGEPDYGRHINAIALSD